MTFLLPDPDDTWDEAFISAAFVSWHTEPSEDGSYIPMTEQEAQETFDRWLDKERAKVWDAALRHVQKLSDPAHTINILPDRELITLGDVFQARDENPYRKDTP